MEIGFVGMCLGVVKKVGIKDPSKTYYNVKLDQRGSSASASIPIPEDVVKDFLQAYDNDVDYHACSCVLEYAPDKSYNPLVIKSIVLTDC